MRESCLTVIAVCAVLILPPFAHAQGDAPRPGVLLHLLFDDNAPVVPDLSGRGNHGARVGEGAKPETKAPMRFDGKSDQVILNSFFLSQFSDFDSKTGQTIEAWFRTSSQEPQGVLGCESPNSFAQMNNLLLYKGKVRWQYRSDTLQELGNGVFDSTTMVCDGKWRHVALVRDGKKFMLIVDGKQEAACEEDKPFGIVSTLRQTVGGGQPKGNNPPSYFKGDIAEIKITAAAIPMSDLAKTAAMNPDDPKFFDTRRGGKPKPSLAATPTLKISRLETNPWDKGIPLVIENAFVRVAIDPALSGTVTHVATKDIPAQPLAAEWYAHHAAFGKFFVDNVTVAGASADLSALPFTVDSVDQSNQRIILKLKADADKAAPGLKVEKIYQIERDRSGFTVTENFINAGTAPIKLALGTSLTAGPPLRPVFYHRYGRMFAGTAGKMEEIFGSWRDDAQKRSVPASGPAYVLMMNTYGKCMGAVIEAPGGVLALEVAVNPVKEAKGVIMTAAGKTPELILEAGKVVTIRHSVYVGDALAGSAAMNADMVAYSADIPRYRPAGAPFVVFATAASDKARTLEIAFRERSAAGKDWTAIGNKTVILTPGAGNYARVELKFAEPGDRVISAVFSERGKEIGALDKPVFIDDGKVAKPPEIARLAEQWKHKFPEYRFQGTWMEIGKQFAEQNMGIKPEALDKAKAEWAAAPAETHKRVADAIAFYRENFPWFLEQTQGQAQYRNVPLEAAVLAILPKPTQPVKGGCIDMAFLQGPDGPLAVWSKERDITSSGNLAYMRIKPAQGYAFHMLALTSGGWSDGGYGINEKGLACCGASLMETEADYNKGQKELDEHLLAGKYVSPAWVPMMLARCATVDEAIKYIKDQKAPAVFVGNMLLIDRAGNAAVLQASGLVHVIRRPKAGLLSCSNYPAEAAEDGRFAKPGDLRGWSNAILRERRFVRLMTDTGGRLGLNDVKWHLACRQEPGPISQTGYNNPACYYTIATFIGHCASGDLYLSCGDSAQTQIVQYRLTD